MSSMEEEIAEWAERRGVLVKSIEDAALGTASVYRALEQALPRTHAICHEGHPPEVDRPPRPRHAVRPGHR